MQSLSASCSPQSLHTPASGISHEFVTPLRRGPDENRFVVTPLTAYSHCRPSDSIVDTHEAFEAWCCGRLTPMTSQATLPSLTDSLMVSTDDRLWIATPTAGVKSSNVIVTTPDPCVTVFHSVSVPKISLSEYGRALVERIQCAPADVALATVVLCRRYLRCTATPPSQQLMHRLYATCFFVVMCAHCDAVVSPSNFAAIAGLHPAEMNRLVTEVLRGVDWRTQVSSDHIATLIAASNPIL